MTVKVIQILLSILLPAFFILLFLALDEPEHRKTARDIFLAILACVVVLIAIEQLS